jgi:hypothetical protein
MTSNNTPQAGQAVQYIGTEGPAVRRNNPADAGHLG